MSDCIFCRIIKGEIGATFVYRDQWVSAFMDIQPINPGHVLVIPNTHATLLADLEAGMGEKIFQTARQVAAALRLSGLPCEGVNLTLADGEAAGQEVGHVHLHVIPRTKLDGFGFKFGPNYGNKPSREELEKVAEKVKRCLP